eukprot:SAG11_NODE_2295_length_3555_cov_20.656250_2_plen_34_part_00
MKTPNKIYNTDLQKIIHPIKNANKIIIQKHQLS